MKNSNTLTKTDFIEYTLWLGVIFALIYRFNCFSGIYGITVFQSKLVFWALVVFLIPLGMYITHTKRRNYVSVLVNIALPFEVYTIMSTFRYIPIVYIIVFTIAILISLLYFCLILFRKTNHKNHIKQIVINRIKFASLGTRTIVAVLLLAIILPLCIQTAFGYELISSRIDVRIADSSDDKWSLSNNIETVAKLHESTWKTLSLTDKLDVLGIVKNIEMRYFGIYHEVYLDTGNLDDNVLGCYNFKEHRITIDIEHLKSDSSEEVLNTLLHECKHVYDRVCVELYNHVDNDYKDMLIFYNISKYKQDFNNYTDCDENPFGYYLQSVEISAREYSELATLEYFEHINKYIQQSET